MDDHIRRQIVVAWLKRDDGIRSPPASEEQLADFERRFGAIPTDVRWFLRTCGGGVVGSEWVDDINALATTHSKFLAESSRAEGWRMRDVFVIGWDGAGNPFGVHAQTGKLMVEDHNFGEVRELAASFPEWLARWLVAE